jgi:GNAT superfamily N-acetyltransferase
MPQVCSYLKAQVPRDIAVQIRSGLRFVWPEMNAGVTKLWALPPDDTVHRRTFVVMEEELVLSHAEANIRMLEHVGQNWSVGGLSAVFAFPSHRGAGHGQRAVAAASDDLRNAKIDFALLFCGERVSSLYLRCGWELWDKPAIAYGDASRPKNFDQYMVMGMMVSSRARDARSRLEGTPLYVGQNTW